MTMDYKKKIEIPFGAFDSELIRQEISIPNGFKAVIDGNKIILTRAESADEKIRKEIVDFIDINTIGSDERRNRWFSYLENQCETYTKRDVDNAYIEGMAFAKTEIDKQSDSPIKWNKNTKDCKPKVSHSVLMKTTHGIAEGEWQGEYWHQYRWAGLVRDADVLSWMELSNLEKQGEEIDFANKEYWRGYREGKQEILDKYADFEKQCKQKPTQEIEPFEAEHGKYYYCIKDYFCGGRKQASKGDIVQALRGLPIMGLKDAGEYFLPVNSIKCNSAWSEEDEIGLSDALWAIKQARTVVKDENDMGTLWYAEHWLKSLKTRYTWKPSDEQMEALESATENCAYSEYQDCLRELIGQLKKLKER